MVIQVAAHMHTDKLDDGRTAVSTNITKFQDSLSFIWNLITKEKTQGI